jgi:hypothetical protein
MHVTLGPPVASFLQEPTTLKASANTLLEREQILIDALLIRFRNIVELTPIPDGEVTKEAAAAQSFQTQVETAALVCVYLHSSPSVILKLTL